MFDVFLQHPTANAATSDLGWPRDTRDFHSHTHLRVKNNAVLVWRGRRLHNANYQMARG